ncbi:MAG: PEP-CTERM sorting domain-containing protein [Colwellia sp.]|nr:PEP-CTERM sorting domain-containing protein [Colwellia sp.]MCW9082675.1 PEP-CTERM sorting domain-containing protein [Colwellia sp.]
MKKIFAGFLLLVMSTMAQASLIGFDFQAQLGIDQIDSTGLSGTYFNQLSSPNFTAVDPGTDLTNFFGSTWDITASQISVTFNSSHAGPPFLFNGFRLVDIQGIAPNFSNVTLFSSSNAGFTAANVNFNNDILTLNMSGLSGGSVVLNYQTTSVPEPSPLAIIALGIAALTLSRRKKHTL